MQNPSVYRPELDGLRAICIVLTVAGHVPGTLPFINGTLGVDIFFALSGWLVTSLLINERRLRNGIDLGSYYIRRIFRIVPLYVVTIALYFAAAWLMHRVFSKGEELSAFVSGIPYFGTFNGEYMQHVDGLLFGHSWTLGIEEKFYILWPLALIGLARQRLSILFAVASLVIVALVVPAFNPELLIRGYVGLAAGAFAAVAASRSTSIAGALAHPLVPGIAVSGLMVAYVAALVLPLPVIWNLLVAVLAVPLIGNIWLRQGKGAVAGTLRWRPLAALGRLTYGVYLTHVLVINAVVMAFGIVGVSPDWWVMFVVAYGASILVGLALHVTIEKPFIALGRSLATRPIKAPVMAA